MSGVDRIWAWEIDHERTPPNGYYATAEVGDATEYVRCDPAVLAALPEVKALVKAAEIAIDVMGYVDGENDCSRGISALEAALAAIRGGSK
jgi:hypothetical protein